MLVKKVIIVFFICCKPIFCEDVTCAINGKRSINTVDDKFLSLSIDPASLITGININYTSLLLAQHLSPSFVRIAGASTEFLKYSKDSDNTEAGITVTASMWQSMNEWFKLANLTPVFAFNDNEKVNGAWNPKPFYQMLDLSDKLNIFCLWQLGFDSSCKTLPQYKEDLLTLKHIVDTFPSKKKVWKVVGSDISGYVYNVSNARYLLQPLLGQVDYFMYENASLQTDKDFPDMSMKSRLSPRGGSFKIWTTAPKSAHAVTFASALEWSRQIGDAARGGYNVVFRQPRLHEFFVDTPTFWVSVLHKYLMGRKVLDLRFSQEKNINLHAYAHCTRKQNDFSKMGAVTVMAVNNETTPHVLALRIGTGNIRKVMIRSYVLTTTNENSVNAFLNGKQLSMEMLEENEKINFSPKLRRAHVTKYLSLPLPEKSISFFVLPGARVPVCANEEYDMKLLMQEIYEDQNVKFGSEENDENYELSNFQTDDNEETDHEPKQVDFNEIFKQIEEELENDEKYYKNYGYGTDSTSSELSVPVMKEYKREIKQRRQVKPRKLFTLDLEIDNDEIKNFLKEKLKERAAVKDGTLTSEEIDEEAEKIAKKVTNAILRKTPKRYLTELKKPLRDTRDINMELVRTRADHSRPHNIYHRRKADEENSPAHLPKISSRRREDTSPYKHSSLRHSQSNLHISPKYHHRTQSRINNFRQSSLHRPYRLKEKRNSKEGIQDVLEFMGENDDTSMFEPDDNFQKGSLKNAELWDAFEFPIEDAEAYDDDLDYSVPFGHSLDYADEDYYELDIYPDDPFMRRKRSAQEGNNVMQEKYHYIVGKPVDPSKIHINPRQKEHQLKLLRQRLSRRRKLESIQRRIRPTTDTSTQNPKIIVNAKRPLSRKKRTALELSLKARYKKYIPRTEHLKQWKPSDILELKQKQAKYKRSIDSSENEIESVITGDSRNMDLALEHSKILGNTSVSNDTEQAQSVENETTLTSTETSTDITESESNCVTNEECLNLILGTSLDPEEFLKPGWASKMYRRVVDFLAKLQKDVLQVMTN